MTETESITLTLTQESDYSFRVSFDGAGMPDLVTDETPPLGHSEGPDPSRLLAAAVGNCLGSTLLFAMRKYKNAPGMIVAHVRAEFSRNERGRRRVARIGVELQLAELAADYAEIKRILDQFEDFCVVTQSVRAGVPVDVSVRDAAGSIVHASEASA